MSILARHIAAVLCLFTFTSAPMARECDATLPPLAQLAASGIAQGDFGAASRLIGSDRGQIEKSYERKDLTWYQALAKFLVHRGCADVALALAQQIEPPIIGHFTMETIAFHASDLGEEAAARRTLAEIPVYQRWPSPRDGAVMLVGQGLIASG